MNKKECEEELKAIGFKFDSVWAAFYRVVDIGSGQVMEEHVYADHWDRIEADVDIDDLPIWHVVAKTGSTFESMWSRQTLHDVKSILSDCLGKYVWLEMAGDEAAETAEPAMATKPSKGECDFLEFQDWMRHYDKPYYWLKDLNGVYGHIATMNLEFRDGEWHVTIACIERGDLFCASRTTLKAVLDDMCNILKNPTSDLVKYLTEKKEIK